MLDIEKLMREGKTLDEIGKMVTAEMDTAQKKIDAEKEAEEAAIKKKETLKQYREAVVAAFTTYLSLVLGEEISEDIVRTAIVELEDSINAIKKIKVSVNGAEIKSLFDLFL